MTAGFIASLYFDRPKAPEGQKRKKVGKLFWDADKQRASILMNGFRLGNNLLFAAPYDNITDPPYLAGDILLKTGEYDKDGVKKSDYLWCGHIQSSQNGAGKTMYAVVIEVMPVGLSGSGSHGIWLNVFNSDRKPAAKPPGPSPTEPNPSDDVPPMDQGRAEDELPF